ncbi:MAG: diguanylate cyclase [Planctomycetaceae bacterium]|nr:diguanylate cyclase [Planctomycetaceae bacterium]
MENTRTNLWTSLQFLCALGAALAVGVVDFLSGPQIGWSLFYLVPIAYCGWRLGTVGGIAVAIVSTLCWIGSEFYWAPDEYFYFVIWNGLTRLVIYVGTAILLGWLRRAIKDLDARNRQLHQIQVVGQMLLACKSVQEAGTIIEKTMFSVLPGTRGYLCLLPASKNALESVATWGWESGQTFIFDPDDCWAIRRGQPHTVGDGRQDIVCPHIKEAEFSGASVCLPMMAQGNVLGVLYVSELPGSSKRTARERAADNIFLHTFGEHIALAITSLKLRESLQQQATRDPLTGLFNRRYMEEWLGRELLRAQRHHRPMGFIMIDLDHFKRYNTDYGHAAGDDVLRQLGAFLLSEMRGGDIVCRYGGEEFLLLLPEADLAMSMRKAEELVRKVREHQFLHKGEGLGTVTLSAGVAAMPEHGNDVDTLLTAADTALREAKLAGRNRALAWTMKPTQHVK